MKFGDFKSLLRFRSDPISVPAMTKPSSGRVVETALRSRLSYTVFVVGRETLSKFQQLRPAQLRQAVTDRRRAAPRRRVWVDYLACQVAQTHRLLNVKLPQIEGSGTDLRLCRFFPRLYLDWFCFGYSMTGGTPNRGGVFEVRRRSLLYNGFFLPVGLSICSSISGPSQERWIWCGGARRQRGGDDQLLVTDGNCFEIRTDRFN